MSLYLLFRYWNKQRYMGLITGDFHVLNVTQNCRLSSVKLRTKNDAACQLSDRFKHTARRHWRYCWQYNPQHMNLTLKCRSRVYTGPKPGHHCACRCPSTLRCQAISKNSGGYTVNFLEWNLFALRWCWSTFLDWMTSFKMTDEISSNLTALRESILFWFHSLVHYWIHTPISFMIFGDIKPFPKPLQT